MLVMNGRRYKLWWSGKGDGVGGVGVMVKEELCDEVVEVRGVSDGVMALVVFEEDVLRLIFGYAPHSGRSLEEEQSFYDKLKCEWDVHSAVDLVMCLGDFSGHVGRHMDGFDGIHGEYGAGQRNLEEGMLLEFCLVKELSMSNTWSKREERRKVTFRMGENETEIDLVLITKEHRQHIQNMKALPGEFQHALVIADIDKRKIRKVVRKACSERKKDNFAERCEDQEAI